MINEYGNIVYLSYLCVYKIVMDYCMYVFGIFFRYVEGSSAREFVDVKRDVVEFIKGCIVVGYVLENDFLVL